MFSYDVYEEKTLIFNSFYCILRMIQPAVIYELCEQFLFFKVSYHSKKTLRIVGIEYWDWLILSVFTFSRLPITKKGDWWST